jgi:hypothetical protein
MSDTNVQLPICPAHIEATIRSIARLHAEHHQNATPLQRTLSLDPASVLWLNAQHPEHQFRVDRRTPGRRVVGLKRFSDRIQIKSASIPRQMNHAERGFRGRRIIAPVRPDAHHLTESRP